MERMVEMKKPEKLNMVISSHEANTWNNCCNAWEEWLAEWLPSENEIRTILSEHAEGRQMAQAIANRLKIKEEK